MSQVFESLKNLKPEDVRRLEILSRVGKRINTPKRFSRALQEVLDAVVESMEAERGALFLVQPQEEEPVLTLYVDRTEEPEEEEFRYSTTVVEKVWREQTPLAEVDASENEDLADMASIQAHGIRSVICVPLIGRESQLGVLYLDNRISDAFTLADLQMLDVIADLASTALERARFFDDLQNLNDQLEARVKQRTAEAEAARVEAERATLAKSLFLAKMSHELRTPLNGVLGLTEDLAQRENNPALKLQMEQVVTSARSLSTLVNGILDYSKLESEQVELDPHPFELEEAISAAVATVNYEADKKGLELQVWVDGSCPLVAVGDSVRLKQILINLLGNAVKFTESGWVRLLASSPQEGFITFSVADSGIGIPKDKQADIFRPFAQADTTTTRQYGGTGLGLSICRALCTLLGGELTVESEPGKGARFAFTIPLQTKQDFVSPDFESLKVGIAVKGAPLRQALVKALKSWNCEIAESLLEAELAIVQNEMEQLYCPTVRLLEPTSIVDPELRHHRMERYLLTPVLRTALYQAMVELADPDGAKSKIEVHPSEPSPPPDSVVLVAEDHEINRLVVEKILRSWSYEVVFAGGGVEAHQLFSKVRPRLVLMDIEMPGLDGFQTTRTIRSQWNERNYYLTVPIIAVTAHLASDLRLRCLASGMDDLIAKPLSRSVLGERMARWEQVLQKQLSREKARFEDFPETSQWPGELLSKVGPALEQLQSACDSGDEKAILDSLSTFEQLSFSAGLTKWGAICVGLQNKFSLDRTRTSVASFQQEWRILAPTLLTSN